MIITAILEFEYNGKHFKRSIDFDTLIEGVSFPEKHLSALWHSGIMSGINEALQINDEAMWLHLEPNMQFLKETAPEKYRVALASFKRAYDAEAKARAKLQAEQGLQEGEDVI